MEGGDHGSYLLLPVGAFDKVWVARSCLTCHFPTASVSVGPALEALYVMAERALGGAGSCAVGFGIPASCTSVLPTGCCPDIPLALRGIAAGESFLTRKEAEGGGRRRQGNKA